MSGGGFHFWLFLNKKLKKLKGLEGRRVYRDPEKRLSERELPAI